jgi:hypothetical protein
MQKYTSWKIMGFDFTVAELQFCRQNDRWAAKGDITEISVMHCHIILTKVTVFCDVTSWNLVKFTDVSKTHDASILTRPHSSTLKREAERSSKSQSISTTLRPSSPKDSGLYIQLCGNLESCVS